MLAAGLLSLTACGGNDAPAAASRLVEVRMTEMAFAPASVAVRAGERVRFRFVNDGTVVHEAVLGDADYQADHEAAMRSPATTAAGDHGGHQHDAADAVTVGPGATMELTWTAASSGTVLIGCHQPGHYAAGMVAEIRVG